MGRLDVHCRRRVPARNRLTRSRQVDSYRAPGQAARQTDDAQSSTQHERRGSDALSSG